MTSMISLSRLAALCAVALILSFAPGASAQGFKWWQADKVVKQIGLTADQTKRLEDVFQKALPELKAQKTTLDAAEAVFQGLIDRGDATAMEQINVVEAARASLNRSRALMLFNMRKVLTVEQWAKFKALQPQPPAAAGQGERTDKDPRP
jgi:Spy/CpxP family protein refolding chaperone